jgi:tryptophanyl-tRNA synthetase
MGALRTWLDLQYRYESFFCIADLHAITTPWRPHELRKTTLDVARTYLAAGLDPRVCTIFLQSHVSHHAELCWVLAALAKTPQLERMTQYKEKARDKGKASLTLLSYPVLMASDILLYRARFVPVGEDQRQHLELARSLATRFNRRFGDTLIVPEALVPQEGARIMSLDDPARKMSKTAPPHTYIALSDPPDVIRAKVKKAVTDPGREVIYGPEKPAISNLLAIYALFSGKGVAEVEEMYRGKGYLDLKTDLADLIIDFLAPFHRAYFSIDDDRVREVLAEGAEKAGAVAALTADEVKERVGLVLPR